MTKYTVRMRDDLAEGGFEIPAGTGYRDYDDLQGVTYLKASELAGAEEYNNGDDPDSHPFQVVKLTDGRVLYVISADLDYNYYS